MAPSSWLPSWGLQQAPVQQALPQQDQPQPEQAASRHSDIIDIANELQASFHAQMMKYMFRGASSQFDKHAFDMCRMAVKSGSNQDMMFIDTRSPDTSSKDPKFRKAVARRLAEVWKRDWAHLAGPNQVTIDNEWGKPMILSLDSDDELYPALKKPASTDPNRVGYNRYLYPHGPPPGYMQ